MDNITDITVGPCEKSNFVKPMRIHYTQNGNKKIWDALKVHDSVVILTYNSTRDVLVFVKQFRPAVYASEANVSLDSDGETLTVDHNRYPGNIGMTYELCAGLVDKNKSLEEIAQDELIEECGYKVPLECIQRISGFRTNVGASAAKQYLFYAEVTDAMKVGPGGGNPAEGEFIEVVEIPAAQGIEFSMDESKLKPVGLMFAILWFFRNIYDKKKNEKA